MKMFNKCGSTHKMIANVTSLIDDLVDIVIKYVGNDPFYSFEGKFLRHIDAKIMNVYYPNGIVAYNDEIYACSFT